MPKQATKSTKKLVLSRQLLYNLVDSVWGDALEDGSVPSTPHARQLIKKAIERTRKEKYQSPLKTMYQK